MLMFIYSTPNPKLNLYITPSLSPNAHARSLRSRDLASPPDLASPHRQPALFLDNCGRLRSNLRVDRPHYSRLTTNLLADRPHCPRLLCYSDPSQLHRRRHRPIVVFAAPLTPTRFPHLIYSHHRSQSPLLITDHPSVNPPTPNFCAQICSPPAPTSPFATVISKLLQPPSTPQLQPPPLTSFLHRRPLLRRLLLPLSPSTSAVDHLSSSSTAVPSSETDNSNIGASHHITTAAL